MPFHYNEKDMEKQEKEKGSGDTNNVLLGSISPRILEYTHQTAD